MQNIHTDNGKIKARIPENVVRLVIHYPAGAQTVCYAPEDHINGRAFLAELLTFGWVPGAIIARTCHLIHPNMPYSEA